MDPKTIIPHREPFLLIDDVTEVVPGVSACGTWTPSKELDIFRGHFPGQPILPGVYIVESLAQLGACAVLSDDRYKGSLPLFGGINKARFRKQVSPGEKLELKVEMVSLSARAGKGNGIACMNGKSVCDVEFFFVIA